MNANTKTQNEVITAESPINADLLITHVDGHADEAYAIWVAEKQGTDRLIGIEKAKKRFALTGPFLTREQYRAAKIVCIGCGFDIFDDHCPTGRIPGYSSTKQVLEKLEVTDHATLELGREIHWCDTNPGVSNTQLAELVKSFHRHYPASTELMLKWTAEAFDAIHYQLSLPLEGDKGESSIAEYLEILVKSGWYKDIKLDHIRKLLEASVRNTANMTVERTYYTELDFIFRAMQRKATSEKSKKAIAEWVVRMFDCLIKDEALFNTALAEAQNEKNHYFARTKGKTLRICLLQSDNMMALRAANYARQQVTMLRKSSGHVNIFIDRKSGYGLDTVMGMIRWLETPVEKRSSLNWHELCTTAGSMDCVPNWYYNREHGQIFNSSSTHKGVLATCLPSQTFAYILTNGFHPVLIGQWMRNHEVGGKRKKVRAATLVQTTSTASTPAPNPTPIAEAPPVATTV